MALLFDWLSTCPLFDNSRSGLLGALPRQSNTVRLYDLHLRFMRTLALTTDNSSSCSTFYILLSVGAPYCTQILLYYYNCNMVYAASHFHFDRSVYVPLHSRCWNAVYASLCCCCCSSGHDTLHYFHCNPTLCSHYCNTVYYCNTVCTSLLSITHGTHTAAAFHILRILYLGKAASLMQQQGAYYQFAQQCRFKRATVAANQACTQTTSLRHVRQVHIKRQACGWT